eukprot:CAMPEP_0171144232 /NCGR_PEP_ID=MMETSP0766_2-20121228/145584_1 /TAXON_ID=439317 /ORGANISM="Gambierdiscus australes, Strain CAWD 149" /LENGTH=111 /DNA_ID=CAMNT_0011608083 /DNA_START=333 /DNA_END=668 /DNA_ORIENTATION=+
MACIETQYEHVRCQCVPAHAPNTLGSSTLGSRASPARPGLTSKPSAVKATSNDAGVYCAGKHCQAASAARTTRCWPGGTPANAWPICVRQGAYGCSLGSMSASATALAWTS